MALIQAAILAVLILPIAPQEAPDKASPFTAVKWDGDKPLVEFEGDWHEFVSLDGVTCDQLVSFCKKEYGRRWRKGFGEDLVEALRKMDKTPKTTVALVLSRDGKNVEKAGTLSKENRRKVWDYNKEHPPKADPETRAAARPAPAPRALYDFESARIVFNYSGQFEGTETFHVADSGKTLVLEVNKKLLTWERKTKIWRDGKYTDIDHNAKKVSLFPIRSADMDLSVRHATDDGLKQIGLLRKGTETVAGKECALYEMANGEQLWRSWRWKGIELKIEMKNFLNCSYVKEAGSVEEGTVIPEALLNVPEGYAK